jgi:hypothetical protein
MRRLAEDRFEIRKKGVVAMSDAMETASLERYARRLDEQLRRVL